MPIENNNALYASVRTLCRILDELNATDLASDLRGTLSGDSWDYGEVRDWGRCILHGYVNGIRRCPPFAVIDSERDSMRPQRQSNRWGRPAVRAEWACPGKCEGIAVRVS